jgi:hypothetical protein
MLVIIVKVTFLLKINLIHIIMLIALLLWFSIKDVIFFICNVLLKMYVM